LENSCRLLSIKSTFRWFFIKFNKKL
jgi:hypothetical protein